MPRGWGDDFHPKELNTLENIFYSEKGGNLMVFLQRPLFSGGERRGVVYMSMENRCKIVFSYAVALGTDLLLCRRPSDDHILSLYYNTSP